MKEKNGTYSNIFISRGSTRDHWPVANLKQFENTVVEHYRKTGFPFYSLTTAEKHRELAKVSTYDHTKLIATREVKQVMHGLSLAWSYFPHSFSIQCGGMRTPMEVFEDDSLFHKTVAKRLKYGLNISDCGIRKALGTFSGTQRVSNFRPLAAAALLHRYLPPTGGIVYDPSSGWGGRMLGAMSCNRVLKYIGCDPSSKTYEGLVQMRAELLPLLNRPLEIELHKTGSEDFRPEPESFDLCMSSPPYGDHEKYADEETQSFIKYPTRAEWLGGYMRLTLENCHLGLKSNGYLVINIAPVKGFPTLHTDFLALAASIGFKHVETLRLRLSKMMGTRKPGQKFKHEPIYVFRKLSS